MQQMFYEAQAFNQDLSSWKDKTNKDSTHNFVSAGGYPLQKTYHPMKDGQDNNDNPFILEDIQIKV